MKCRFNTSTRGVVILCTLLGIIVAVLIMKRRTLATVDVVKEDSTIEFEPSELVRNAPNSSSWRSVGSLGSARSIGSIGSFCSIGSIGSSFSIGSIGSSFSIGSIGSFCSIASIASAASVGSFAGIGACFSSRAIADTSRRT